MKSLITPALLLLASLGTTVSAVDFSYNHSSKGVVGFGYSKAETYDVAILLNQPALIGQQVTGFTVPFIGQVSGATDFSGWSAAKLELQTVDGVKVNKPDQQVSITPSADGTLTATFSTPVTVPEGGLYVGYSFTVTDAQSAPEPVASFTTDEADAMWIHTSQSQTRWVDMSKRKSVGSPMVVSLSGDFAAEGAVPALKDKVYFSMEEANTLACEISNQGTEAISSIDYTYSIGSVTGSGTYNFSNPVQGGIGITGRADISVEIPEQVGEYEVTFRVDAVNGVANRFAESNAQAQGRVQLFIPVNRPLVEEYTGLGCVFCPRGYVMLEQMKDRYGLEFVGAAYHGCGYESGCMVSVEDKNMPASPGSLPNAQLNRSSMMDPATIPDAWEKSRLNMPTAQIDVDLEWADEAQTQLKAVSHSRFLNDETDTYYKISYLLVADGLSDPSWLQGNAYADYKAEGEYTGPYWDLFVGQPATVQGLTFNDVAVYYTTTDGVEDSVPADIRGGEVYDHTYTIDIADVKNVKGETIVKDFNKVRVIAILLNGRTRKPVNCASSLYPDGTKPESGVKQVSDTVVSVASTEYYDLQGRRVARPTGGIYIQIDKLCDGSSRATKIVK